VPRPIATKETGKVEGEINVWLVGISTLTPLVLQPEHSIAAGAAAAKDKRVNETSVVENIFGKLKRM